MCQNVLFNYSLTVLIVSNRYTLACDHARPGTQLKSTSSAGNTVGHNAHQYRRWNECARKSSPRVHLNRAQRAIDRGHNQHSLLDTLFLDLTPGVNTRWPPMPQCHHNPKALDASKSKTTCKRTSPMRFRRHQRPTWNPSLSITPTPGSAFASVCSTNSYW